jgi:hypothetical protein
VPLFEPIVPVEYELTLSDGQRMAISELDTELIPAVHLVRGALESFISRCASLTRFEVEEAKRGYDKMLRQALRSPMAGLARAEPPVCRLREECIMFSAQKCTLRNSSIKGGSFPFCWEYDASRALGPLQGAAIALGTALGQAWRIGRYVVLIKAK